MGSTVIFFHNMPDTSITAAVQGWMDFYVVNNTASTQTTIMEIHMSNAVWSNSGATTQTLYADDSSTSSVDTTTDQAFLVEMNFEDAGTNNNFTIDYTSVEIIK